ncbi:hypothetical protein Y032_0001g87 [Ancylostoma ceylanicum]|uniref:Uncharacterized protein n=1 Tax=Ancylostoma ceylanicum TaxID=53326 RepID=A0A016W505_9BILA|nr:hypothetical protein Y032_0001g87 [Ancylostoma ceylanicum]
MDLHSCLPIVQKDILDAYPDAEHEDKQKFLLITIFIFIVTFDTGLFDLTLFPRHLQPPLCTINDQVILHLLLPSISMDVRQNPILFVISSSRTSFCVYPGKVRS